MDSTRVIAGWHRARLARAERHRAPLDHADRLAGLVERVVAHSPRLVDGWEAAAIVESLGYTDRRVQTEFGLSDTRLAGEHVYRLSRAAPASPAEKETPVDRLTAAGDRGRLLAYAAALTAVGAARLSGVDVGWLAGMLAAAAIAAEAGLRVLSGQIGEASAHRSGVDRPDLAWSMKLHHRRALALAASVGTLVAGGTALVRIPFAAGSWSIVSLHALSAAGLAVTLLNAFVLAELGRGWSVAHAALLALTAHLAWRYAAGNGQSAWLALAWPSTVACAAIASSLLARQTLARVDYACARSSTNTSALVLRPEPR